MMRIKYLQLHASQARTLGGGKAREIGGIELGKKQRFCHVDKKPGSGDTAAAQILLFIPKVP
jgi:hypothetical protein